MATYIVFVFLSTTIAKGDFPTGISFSILLFCTSITEIKLSPLFATYILFVIPLLAIATGCVPTRISFPILVLFCPSITEIALASRLAT
ncbi:MAG: hypothetical protein WA364_02875 [Candidatus Nitrosopolaris sp.]